MMYTLAIYIYDLHISDSGYSAIVLYDVIQTQIIHTVHESLNIEIRNTILLLQQLLIGSEYITQ